VIRYSDLRAQLEAALCDKPGLTAVELATLLTKELAVR
jgi:hypothetical protein